MRVALIPSAYHPSLGGVEELTRRLAAQLLAEGHEVEVWSSRREGDSTPPVDSLDGITVRRFTFPLPRAAASAVLAWPRPAVAVLQELRRAAREFQPDVLHVQCFSSNGVYAAALSTLTRIPLVVTLQGETMMDDRDIFTHSQVLRAGLRWGLRRASRITACSQYTLDDAIRRFGADPGKSQIVFNGVTLEEASAEQDLDVPFETFALAMGRVVHKKGFDLLLEGFAQIAELPPGCGLVIGGEGAELEGLRERANALGIADRVVFPGRLERAQVAWAMRNARCFVMPSRLEPFGIVILEAWRAGTAVIASSIGGPPEFVEDEVDGLLVDPHDAQGLAQALTALLTDPADAERLGKAGQQRVHDFTWPLHARAYLAVYERARAGPPRGEA